jgi:hypothetical protein
MPNGRCTVQCFFTPGGLLISPRILPKLFCSFPRVTSFDQHNIHSFYNTRAMRTPRLRVRRLCASLLPPHKRHFRTLPRATLTANVSFDSNPLPDSLNLSEWSSHYEEEITKLASKPLRDLNLADLIRFAPILSSSQHL